jgi:predicted house-cleaning noncanonical NTP pyrophosphatase (MazG superfamily)
MATTKLTLSVEPEVISKARHYASKHRKSVSKIFSELLNKAVEEDEAMSDDPFLKKLKEIEIAPEIKALSGILKGKYPDDVNIWDVKYEYLKEKNGL